MKTLSQLFPTLLSRVERLHRENPEVAQAGHDFDHDLRVATYALLVAPDLETGRLAAAAGLCHSADRFIQVWEELGRNHADEDSVRELVLSLLWREPNLNLDEEGDVIINSVLGHGRPNGASDHPVLVNLMDGDRIANSDSDVIGRSTRHHPDYPIVDYVHGLDDPAATYPEPRSVLRDVHHCLEWSQEGGPYCVRLPKSWPEITWRHDILRRWVEGMVRSRQAVDWYYQPAA